MTRLIVLVLVMFALGVATEGCKKDSSTEPETPATNTPPVTQATFPTGTFSATDNDGSWVMTFKPDSTFTLTHNGSPVFSVGRYTPSGARVVLSENSSLCSGSGDGTYSWGLSGTSLTFAVVTDGCIARKNTLTSNTWKKSTGGS